MSLLLVVEVVTFVATAVMPGEHSLPVHLVVEPAALILAAIAPSVLTLSFDVVIREVTSVG
jgi:hypothetical protein